MTLRTTMLGYFHFSDMLCLVDSANWTARTSLKFLLMHSLNSMLIIYIAADEEFQVIYDLDVLFLISFRYTNLSGNLYYCIGHCFTIIAEVNSHLSVITLCPQEQNQKFGKNLSLFLKLGLLVQDSYLILSNVLAYVWTWMRLMTTLKAF